tara:strand:- start:2440 stop:2706 length:267 start_codon:yes stop_codon:yes gene_type:complete
MTYKMCASQTLHIDKVYLDDKHKLKERDMVLEYSDIHPTKLYLRIHHPDLKKGTLHSYSMEEVKRLKTFISRVYIKMQENRDGDGSNL